MGGVGVTVRRGQGTGRGKDDLEIIAFTQTDEEGEFSLVNLPIGIFKLNIQYPGYPMDEFSFVMFTIGNNPLEQSIRIEANVLNNKIVVRQLVITELEAREQYSIRIFPNPSQEYITILFDIKVEGREIVIVDAHGKNKLTLPAAETTNILNTLSWSKGVYLVTIRESNSIHKTI